MKKLRLFVIGGLLIFTAFCGGLLASSWSSQATANSNQAALSAPTSQQDQAKQPGDPEPPVWETTVTTAEFGEAGFGEIAFSSEPADTFKFFEANGDNGDNMAFATPAMPGVAFTGGPNAEGPEAQGVITQIENNGAKITVNKQRVINLNDQTTIGDANGSLKKEDLKVGDRVVVLGKVESDKALTARYFLRQPALPIVLNGAVSSVDTASNSLKFKIGKDNVEWTATASSSTKISRNGNTITLGDLKPGDNIVVSGKADKEAKKIEANVIATGRPQMPPRPMPGNMSAGTVKSIDTASNSFVISETTGITPTERKITVDSNTKFAGPKSIKGLADLKVGDKVLANGEKQADGSLKAIHVATGIDIQFRTGPGEKGNPNNGKGSRPTKPGAPPNAPNAPQPPEPPKDKQG